MQSAVSSQQSAWKELAPPYLFEQLEPSPAGPIQVPENDWQPWDTSEEYFMS